MRRRKKRAVPGQVLIGLVEGDHGRTGDTEGAKISVTVTNVLNTTGYLLRCLPLQITISGGCTAKDKTNRGCHICPLCFQKQLVVRGGAHVPLHAL